MTRNETEDSVDLWRQVASAVEYIATVERPGFTVWDALSDAVRRWLPDGLEGKADCRSLNEADPLRSSIETLMTMRPPAGAPGGNAVGDLLSAAVANWLERVAADLNDGHRFDEARDRRGGR